MAAVTLAIDIARFIAKLYPDVREMLVALYHAFDGDVEKARGAIHILRDHGGRLDRERLEVDHELAELRAGRSKPDA